MNVLVSALVVLVSLLTVPVQAQEFEKGVAADRRADFAGALAAWLAAADKGDARAQNSLGRMYQTGRGVPRDHGVAARWYRLAAEGGDIEAQYSLGLAYAIGRGVAPDDVQALKWLSLAATHGHNLAFVRQSIIIRRMTAADVSAAQRLARGWLEEHRD